jgi:hypothetical protein
MVPCHFNSINSLSNENYRKGQKLFLKISLVDPVGTAKETFDW